MRSNWKPWLAGLALAWLAWRVGTERFAPPPAPAPVAPDAPDAANPALLARGVRSPEEAVVLALDGRPAHPAARALEAAGLSWSVTDSTAAAFAHRVIVLPLDDRDAAPAPPLLEAFRAWVSSGGALVLSAPSGGDPWRALTGLESVVPSRARRRLLLRLGDDPAAPLFPAPADQEVRLASDATLEGLWTLGLRPARGEARVLAQFEDREPALTVRRLGAGRVYVVGASFLDLHARPLAGRHLDAARAPRGGAREGGADLLPDLLRAWAASAAPVTARLRGLPGRASGALAVSVELGETPEALEEAREFALGLSSAGLRATWFVRTGPPALDARRASFLAELAASGHEVASRGEVLPPDFESLPFGDGSESERSYRPRVEVERARGATLLGEASVSRARLKSQAGVEAAGFRGPEGLWPEALELALSRAGYLYDATPSAASVLTQRPFPHASRRGFSRESAVIAVPTGLRDRRGEATAPSTALALLAEVSAREGVLSWVVAADKAGLAALKGVAERLPPGVEWLTLVETARDRLERARTRHWLVPGEGAARELVLELPEGGVRALSVELTPAPKSCATLEAPAGATAACEGAIAVIASPSGGVLRLRLDLE